jgi:multisubunit Na+/H+ antiporter MnhE subunit
MLHAAAMLLGLILIWLALTQRAVAPLDWALAGLVALAALLIAWRFGGLGRGFARTPQVLVLGASRANAIWRGAVGTVRAAIAADVTLQPALVRVKSRVTGAEARAMLADMISAAPGQVVVEADADGLLLHVIDEEAVDAAALGALEAQVLRVIGREAPA